MSLMFHKAIHQPVGEITEGCHLVFPCAVFRAVLHYSLSSLSLFNSTAKSVHTDVQFISCFLESEVFFCNFSLKFHTLLVSSRYREAYWCC